jgi:hypothetical protein
MQRDRRTSAARLLHGAAATLAAGVVTDSTAEHYRAGFHNPVMFVAPVVSLAALATALSASVAPDGQRTLRHAVFAGSIATGFVGLAFHLKNVSRRPGGWNASNVFHGAPLAAPLAVTMAGLLGLAASRLGNGRSSASRTASAIGVLSALGLIGTSTEATALHFRGAFQNPFMYAPVALPPLTAVTLATASLTHSTTARAAAARLLGLTWWMGMIGVGFHAWGVHRRMGGWRNWRQNLLSGPPLPAPPAFTGLALAGLASLDLLNGGRAR